MSRPKYLFLDLETTGLDPGEDRILECAAVVTDEHLEELATFEMVLHADRSWIRTAVPFVQDMHTANGLADACEVSPFWLEDLDQALNGLLDLHFPGDARAVLAGNSVHFDRAFLAIEFPTFVERLSHRHLDATTLRFAAEDVGHRVPSFADGNHRAMADARSSIAQVRHVRRIMGEAA